MQFLAECLPTWKGVTMTWYGQTSLQQSHYDEHKDQKGTAVLTGSFISHCQQKSHQWWQWVVRKWDGHVDCQTSSWQAGTAVTEGLPCGVSTEAHASWVLWALHHLTFWRMAALPGRTSPRWGKQMSTRLILLSSHPHTRLHTASSVVVLAAHPFIDISEPVTRNMLTFQEWKLHTSC